MNGHISPAARDTSPGRIGSMSVLRQVRLADRDKVDAEQLVRIAGRQGGVLSARQLRALGLTRAAISRWMHAGRLHGSILTSTPSVIRRCPSKGDCPQPFCTAVVRQSL